MVLLNSLVLKIAIFLIFVYLHIEFIQSASVIPNNDINEFLKQIAPHDTVS